MTQQTPWCFTSGHFFCLKANQNRSCNEFFESRSFCQACAVRSEDSTHELESSLCKGNAKMLTIRPDNSTRVKTLANCELLITCRRFNQIINCCRYFVSQTGKGLVTLLTGASSYESPKRGQRKGCSGTRATPEAVELARSCGVNVESLRAFCARFCSHSKSVT